MGNPNWIDQVITDCEHVETPRSWLWWSLCCAISAAAGNNYYLKTLKGAVLYKPNLYVILLGESGLGKGFPINLSKILVQRSDATRVIAGRSSIQAIVKELSTLSTRPDGRLPFDDSRGYIVNGELSTAIISDPDSLTILTDLYDGHYNPEWTNLLKGDGAEKLKEPYITALFGSSPAHFYDSIPQVNIEGGYIGRNLIDYQEKRYKDSDLLDEEDDGELELFPYDKHSEHLVKISRSKGRMIPDNDARRTFNTWRKKWRANQPSDNTGFVNRVPDHVLKTAMCLTLARLEDFNLVIGQAEIEESLERVLALTYANKRATEGKSLVDPLAQVTKIVLDVLLTAENHQVRRKTLANRLYSSGIADSALMDKAVDNLIDKGWIVRERVSSGKSVDWLYVMSGEPLAQYQKFIKDREVLAKRRGVVENESS